MGAERKSCLACFEPVDARALKCPHCHQVQGRTANWVNRPAVLNGLVIFVVLLLAWLAYSTIRKLERPPFVEKLVVGEATLRQSDVDGQRRVSCLAPIRNSDSLPWGRLSLQAEFLDAQGRVIDVHQARTDFTMSPGFGSHGRVSGPANGASADYSGCRITILHATAGY
jgi:hypothetical protein